MRHVDLVDDAARARPRCRGEPARSSPRSGSRVPIHAAAIANDPALATMQSWDLKVMARRGLGVRGHVAGARRRAARSTQNQFGGSTRPNPAFFQVVPALEFTTYITAPSDIGSAACAVDSRRLAGERAVQHGPRDRPRPRHAAPSTGPTSSPTRRERTRSCAADVPAGSVFPNVINIADVGSQPGRSATRAS